MFDVDFRILKDFSVTLENCFWELNVFLGAKRFFLGNEGLFWGAQEYF